MLLRKVSLVLGVILAASAVGAQTAGTRNVSNAPFATVADGLLGPVVVDVPAGASRAAVDMAVTDALRAKQPSRAAASATQQFLVRRGLLRPGSRLTLNRPVVLRQGGRVVLPDLERAGRTRGRLGEGEITFTYEGWSADDAASITQFVNTVYPIAKDVYGAPSANITVRIVRDINLTDASMHLRNGIYNASTNEIRFNPTGAFEDDMYSLTHLILYAFHDDAIFSYDAWEEGFTWAATYVTYKRVVPGYDLGESFKTFYFLQLYELINQPGIGNARFWPASFDQMVAADRTAVFPFTLFVFRSGLAGAAWAKVYTENNAFFRDFNAAYYQQFNTGLAGNVPALKAIAAGVVPTVEGLGFLDWYRRQYILDTAITPGRHLWGWALPQFTRDDGAGAHLVLLLYHFGRDVNGNEAPMGGTANLIYWSWDFIQDYYAEEGNVATIPAAGNDAGVGTISPGVYNVGGAQKINVHVTVDGLTRTVLWPYLVRGTEADARNFWGVTLESENGEVGVIPGSGAEQTTALSQGAFGMNTDLNGWRRLSIRVADAAGRSTIRQVNAGYDFYAAIVQGPRPTAASYSLTLPAGLHLMSVPAHPTVPDPEALGVPANRLRLAHWDPSLYTGDVNYRYRLFPGTPALAPGIGYWLELSQETTIRFDGNPLPQDQSHMIPLRSGWNQIGHPFLQDVPASTLRVVVDPTDPSQSLDIQEAVAQGMLSGTLWDYTRAEGFVASDTLRPWHGYFVKAERDLLLLVPAVASPGQNPAGALVPGNPIIGDNRSRAARSRTAPPRPTRVVPVEGWRLRLQARVENVAGGVTVGASRSAGDGFDPLHDAQQPPAPGNYVRLAVQHSDWGRAAGDYSIDVRRDGAAKYSWDVNLDTNLPGRDVTLTCPNLAGLPKDLRFTLVDLDGGRRYYLRTTGSVTVNSGETGRRRLRLEATRGSASMLAITDIQVRPTRGTGTMDVQFTLSGDAVVDAHVLSPGGRTVRQVARSRAFSAGVNHLPWDGRSDLGAAMQPGIYLLQLTATTEEGQSVRAVRPMVLTR